MMSGLFLVTKGEAAEDTNPVTTLDAAATELFDRWVHPRGEAFDADRHYKDSDGELFYHEENDIAQGIGSIVVHGGSEARVTAKLGADLWAFLERNSGSLNARLLVDSDGDGKVDKTIRGTLEDQEAVFTGEAIAPVNWRSDTWQMGVVYRAGKNGNAKFDGRYLSSVNSKSARVVFSRLDGLAELAGLPAVGAGPRGGLPDVGAGPRTGLIIFKHRGSASVDLIALAKNPRGHLDDFDALTRVDDDDDWTVDKLDKGRLRTHFEQEDLFLVLATQGSTLEVEWGDVPLQEFLEEQLEVKPDADGCLSTLESSVSGDDDTKAPVPHRILYCPDASMALFEAPDGYQIGLVALADGEQLERTEASTSILDNVRLYAKQVNPRSPRARATGTVLGNISAGLKHAGQDIVDIGRHLVTGTERRNIHTGQIEQRTSLLMAIPKFAFGLAKLQPITALNDLVEGIQSGVQIGADGVSAVNNAIVNPLIQTSVGVIATPAAADTADHWFGAFTQAWAQNLPASERTTDALSPISMWNHNRAFAPVAYTRTDTQLNIDRFFTLVNIAGVYGITASAGNSGGGSKGGAGSTGGTPPGSPPPAVPPAPPPVVTPPVITPPITPTPCWWWGGWKL